MSDPYALTEQAGALLERLHDRDTPRVYRALPGQIPHTDPACLWARARRRYLRRIAALPAVESPIGGRMACQSCRHWRSQNGETGYCAMPETPATVNCGATKALDLCEQWDAWPKRKRARGKQ